MIHLFNTHAYGEKNVQDYVKYLASLLDIFVCEHCPHYILCELKKIYINSYRNLTRILKIGTPCVKNSEKLNKLSFITNQFSWCTNFHNTCSIICFQ